MYIKKKGKAGCACRQLRGLVVNCAQGQVWETQLESPLILTSMGIPTPDVKKTIRDPSIVKLIWASNLLTGLIIGVTSQKSLLLRIAHMALHGSHLSVSR